MFPEVVVCGYLHAGELDPSRPKLVMNPDDSYVMEKGDKIVVVGMDGGSFLAATMLRRSCVYIQSMEPRSSSPLLNYGHAWSTQHREGRVCQRGARLHSFR